MGTCFSPSATKILIHVDIVNQIYSEVQKLHSSNNLDIYDHIKEKISKKGLFKKLIDHLSSHRVNLNDCMAYNFRLFRQNKTIQSRITTLIIIDQLVANLRLFTTQQIFITKTNDRIIQKKKPQKNISSVNRDIEIKFQKLYFQIILEMFQKQVRLREKLMDSISNFAKKRQQNFNCDKQIWQILDNILNQIKSENQINKYIKTYAQVLQKSNQNIQKNQNKVESLKVFINLWMNAKQEDTIKENCSMILKIYISRCLTSREYGFIYQLIFQKYDQHKFIERDLMDLENKILNIIYEEDLSDQFLKGMFKHLLSYLCFTQNDYIKSRWQDGLFDLHFEAVKIIYTNIQKRQNKINGFTTLTRWINKNFVNINQVVSFNRNAFVFCFIFNIIIFIEDKLILDKIIEIFFQIGSKCDDSSKMMLFQFLIDQIYRSTDDIIDSISILVKICKKFLKQNSKFINSMLEPTYSFFRQISVQIPNRTKNQIIQLYCNLLDYYNQNFPTNLIQMLCDTIFSFYANLEKQQPLKQKYFIVCSILTFFRKLKQKKQTQLLIIFAQKLIIAQRTKSIIGQNNIKRYFQRFICMEIYQLIQQKKYIPQQIRKINSKIHTHQNRIVITQINDYLFKNPNLDLKLTKAEEIQIQSIRKSYQFISKQFQRCQRNTQIFLEEDLQLNVLVNTGFSNQRKNSILSLQESNKADQSFQDIYGMIHQIKNRQRQQPQKNE